MIHPEARINVPKEGPTILKRVCKAGNKCPHYCEHKNEHIVSILCNLKCCDVPGKDVRCV